MEKESPNREKELQEIRLEGDMTSTKEPLYSEVVNERTQEANRNKEKIKSSGNNKMVQRDMNHIKVQERNV